MRTAVLLFTRDLRVHDNPTVVAAVAAAETVLPLFVVDDGIRGTRYGAAANRGAFLLESLADLDTSLRKRGAALTGDHKHVRFPRCQSRVNGLLRLFTANL